MSKVEEGRKRFNQDLTAAMSDKPKFTGKLKVEYNAPLATVPGHFIREGAENERSVALLWEGGGTHGKPLQRYMAAELVRRWNAFEQGGVVKEMYAALMNCVAILERQRPGRHDLVPAHAALRHARGEK